jgi:glycosyltransferase involved in cell wall biosynthesis
MPESLAITGLVLTRNERENISLTLSALTWLRRVVVLDSFSNDGTVQLAATYPNVTVVQHEFFTFAEQCNFGLQQVTTPWVLSLDADYVLTPELIAEIEALNPDATVSGYKAEFNYCVHGHRLRGSLYPPRAVLYRREAARYCDEGHGHRVHLEGVVQLLRGRINHDDRKSLSRWIAAQDCYSITEARHLIAARSEDLSVQDRLRKCIFFAPAAVFLYLLFGKGLILDGWRGWYYVCQRTIAEMLLSLRLITQREALEQEPGKETPPV